MKLEIEITEKQAVSGYNSGLKAQEKGGHFGEIEIKKYWFGYYLGRAMFLRKQIEEEK